MLQVTPSYSNSSKYSQSLKSISTDATIHSLINDKNPGTVLNSENCFEETVEKNKHETASSVNLLNLLNSCQNKSVNGNVFKPIGNRIVVPLKLPTKSKPQVQPSNNYTKTTKYPASFQSFVPIKTTKPIKMEYSFEHKKIIDMTWKSSSTEEADYSVFTPIEIKKEVEQQASFVPQITTKSTTNSNNDFVNIYGDNLKPIEKMNCFTSQLRGHANNLSQSDVYAELTCLSWLRNGKSKQILEILKKCNPDRPIPQLPAWLTDNEYDNVETKMQSIFTAYSKIQSFQRLPAPIPSKFDPKDKPPFSFSCLIFMAIEDSETKQLKVKEIYEWFRKHYPYFRSSCTSWRNSIRHNLSLNRCFSKAKTVKIKENSPKNTLWCVHPAYRPNLIEALKKANALYCNYHNQEIVEPAVLRNLTNSPSRTYAERSPYCQSSQQKLSSENSDPDMTSAALNLIDLRENGTTIKSEEQAELIHHTIEEIFRDSYFKFQCGLTDFCDNLDEDNSIVRELIVIRDSSEDHQYCIPNSSQKALKHLERRASTVSVKSEPDAAYEFETASSDKEEQDMDIVQDIMEDVMVESEDEEKEVSLFDSGFGSIRNFERDLQSEKRKKSISNRKPALHSSESRPKKAKKAKDKMICENLKPVLFKADKKEIISNKKKSPKKIKKTCYKSKISKTAHGSVLKQHSRPVSNAKYHTRSKRGNLPSQQLETKKRIKRTRKNSFRRSLDASEDDEVKRAAGSLLRLAGLIKSNA